ncbi:energy transducer TonB [uncultured Tenacibaculum sp.]|uniref:energy transducer TonB n=1 Tax=uncultured Tenacibaculum sp. TaxID=174713 RepID=UPI00262F9184|nr:energy transducer TonB [uncultured Tenacibaculum sp.]
MTKIHLLLILVMISITSMFAQKEVCETPEDSFDVNSITKCAVEEPSNKKKSRQITVKVSASKRFMKKRELAKKQAATGVGSLGTSGIQSTANESPITKGLAFKTNIEDLKNKLSAEEVRKASKFSEVDKIPSFSACKKTKKGERVDCFNEEMMKHIQKYFHYPSKAVQESIQGEVWVRFIIDKDGNVKNIKTLGPKNGEILNHVAQNVVHKLPQFAPAKKNGSRVAVKYGFPITFSLEE